MPHQVGDTVTYEGAPYKVVGIDPGGNLQLAKAYNPTETIEPNLTRTPDEAYAQSLKDTAGKTLHGIKEGVIGSLNPINALKTGYRFATQSPITSAKEVYGGLKDTVEGVMAGDPEVGGQAIGMLAAPKIAEAVPVAVRGATKMAVEHPEVTKAAGALATAAALKSMGTGGMFGGLALGRALTGAALKKLGPASEEIGAMTGMADDPSAVISLGEKEIAALKKQGYSDETIAKMRTQGKLAAPPGAPTPPTGPPAMRIPAPMASHEPTLSAPAKAEAVTNQILDRQALHQPSPTAGVPTRNPMGPPQPPPPPPQPVVPPSGVLSENLDAIQTPSSRDLLMDTLSREGAGPQPKVGVERIPPSKSSRTPRAVTPQLLDEQGMKTPLTTNDVQALVDAKIITPEMAKMPITQLTREGADVIRKARMRRAGQYREQAELDAIATRQGGE
jgi:hypothetical protein